MSRRIVLVDIGNAMVLRGVLPSVAVGASYNASVIASGGAAPYTYTITAGADALTAAGIQLDPATGIFSASSVGGAGNIPITVRATGINGAYVQRQFVVTVIAEPLVLTITGTYPSATLGTPYSADLLITNGVQPYDNARVTAGTLPGWATLTLVADKLRLSGTPNTAGTVNITVAVDSSEGQTASSAQSFEVVVAFVPVAFDPTYAYSDVVLADQNYTASRSGIGYKSVYGTTSKSAGKWQIEARVTAIGGTIDLGVADKSNPGTDGGDSRGILRTYAGDINFEGQFSCGIWTVNGSAFLFRHDSINTSRNINSQGAGSLSTGDYLSVCIDLDAGAIAFYKNGTLIAGTNVTLIPLTYFPAASFGNNGKLTLTNGALVYPIAGYAQWG